MTTNHRRAAGTYRRKPRPLANVYRPDILPGDLRQAPQLLIDIFLRGESAAALSRAFPMAQQINTVTTATLSGIIGFTA